MVPFLDRCRLVRTNYHKTEIASVFNTGFKINRALFTFSLAISFEGKANLKGIDRLVAECSDDKVQFSGRILKTC